MPPDKLPETEAEFAEADKGLVQIEPDEVDMHHAGHQSLPPCPFCGRYPLTMPGKYRASTGIYQYTVQCVDFHCNASVFYNGDSRESARNGAIAAWSKRVN